MSNADQRRAYHAGRERDKYKKLFESARDELVDLSLCPVLSKLATSESFIVNETNCYALKKELPSKTQQRKFCQACWQRYFEQKEATK